jgi:hypothetical protein
MAESQTPQEPQPKRRNDRMLPGGSLEDSRRAIGVNAVDREMLPSYGAPPKQTDYGESPDEAPPLRPTGPKQPTPRER